MRAKVVNGEAPEERLSFEGDAGRGASYMEGQAEQVSHSRG
jgi:hypothetical protein